MTKDEEEVRTFIKSNVSGLVKLVKNEAADSSTKANIISWMAAVSSTRVCSSIGLGYKKWYYLCIF
ncbi:hypothetical protein Ctob_011353 [Chrysochromulina tobinii]|uniref:Uncharacterized protein n=1 Tax=Chrysochromulina tobinii TaxID=1460289 RepID=A0A0M0K6Y9_9EUKA|nr:hypothetical protein Ctob_011353 [Chrysochromulina tobinii]|eukprot:KOO34367.1 hypothetical protein Ctob_011353 [Chrysochromulina sp. CCMP291]